jgi:tripartite-type tricarboxylate transporter receptor subunit TctC
MKICRRKFLHLGAGAAAPPAASRLAWAQAYPSHPVRIIVGFPAGSSSDIAARLIAQWLSEHLGQPFVIENRPGAGGSIATDAVVRAPADGYALLLAGSNDAINATLYEHPNFSFIHDLTPVAGILDTPLVMVVNPSLPAKTLPEFIAYTEANPSRVSMASGGNGSTPHLSGELFKVMAGLNILHVPYRGSPQALTDLIGGQVQVLFSPILSSIDFIRAGKLRALAVTTATRQETLPNIPAVAEFVPGYEAITWNGLSAPKNTPVEIVEKLNKEINSAFADPKMKARLADLGATPLPGSSADFGKFIAAETEKWGKVIRAGNIKAE